MAETPAGGGSYGIETIDVKAVNRREDRSLYASRQKIYAKLAHGTFRKLKWVLMAITLGIYYLIPWLRWDRGPDLPNQAVLLDLNNQRFFVFGLEIWPQEFYFVTGLLVLAALVLFLSTALAGRIWCGYFCPQTVWTDLMIAVERFWQGDRNARIRLDKSPWTTEKIYKKGMTHLTWLFIAMTTGGAFIYYFADTPTLVVQFFTGTAPFEAYLFFWIFTFTTYLLGGIVREQLCIYMCPWPRIQGAMVDKDSLLVTYHDHRGEPRGAHRKGTTWDGRGDCVDCMACIAVCPMGIDIRDGAQLECIQCALCIDACNEIMERVGRPANLIAYDTIAGQAAARENRPARIPYFRSRTLLYFGLIALVGTIMLIALNNRTILETSVLADRNPLFVQLANGDIRNGYTLKILNKRHEPREFDISIDGLPDATFVIQGQNNSAKPVVSVPTDVLKDFRIFVIVPAAAVKSLNKKGAPFAFLVRDTKSGEIVRRETAFRRP